MPRPRRDPDQLDLLDPPAEGWFEVYFGDTRVWVIADDGAEALAKAEAQMRDIGVLPGGPPGLHDSYLRMCERARRGRR